MPSQDAAQRKLSISLSTGNRAVLPIRLKRFARSDLTFCDVNTKRPRDIEVGTHIKRERTCRRRLTLILPPGKGPIVLVLRK
jgi:hypothetical protein